ncbi:phospho-sugar mutase [Pseudobacteroides cellulosolvens]|nr:phospho-sugar mutase [Pseudobacteroides cellulosolvens]
MDTRELFNFWLTDDYFDTDTKNELSQIKDNEKEIVERFYKELEFGTGGLRGIIGAGTNRMNIYTVRKAAQGVANYIKSLGKEAMDRGVVISFDSRNKSPEFALESAKVYTGNGIKTYLFNELRPVPVLSFAVRFFNTAVGIMVTASHNPKEYNGYKVYGEDGAQLSLEGSNIVLDEIGKIKDMSSIALMDKEEALNKGLLKIVGIEIENAFISEIKKQCINPDLVKEIGKTMKIVYTPLHGTGNKPVRRVLKENGFENVIVVKEQEIADPNFSTVKSPNPEDKEALTMAIELAAKEDSDLVIGTDPDCDRVGIAVRNKNGEYVVFTGNQTGCLLMEYMLSQKKANGNLPTNGFVAKTIVSSELSRKIASAYDIEVIEVLTGFKFIGEKIKELDEYGNKKYIFGFEESYGYLAGTHARDKDGVVASMLIAEMAAYFKSKGMTLYDALEELFKKYGYTIESITSFTLAGKEGLEKIKFTMDELRKARHSSFGTSVVSAIRDYAKGERYDIKSGSVEKLTLPESDVLYYEMEDGSWFCVRPSGTEPKIKIYYGVTGTGLHNAQGKLDTLRENVLTVVKKFLYE